MSSQVSIRKVNHEFPARQGAVAALADVSLDFPAGEFVCIVGASGCGKSTLLSILAGTLTPTSGEVLVGGQQVSGPHHSRGMVFQQPQLLPWLTVRGNVAFGPVVRGENASADTIAAAIDAVGLSEFSDAAVYELSGGMQQRVAIARLLVNNPDLMLLDEPFAALDALSRETLQAELLALWRREHRTMVFVTHSIEEAVYLGTIVVLMSPRPGRIVDVIDVRLPHLAHLSPRAVRLHPEFIAMRQRVEEHFHGSLA
ncbi:MAG: ABC transporter ATP-binding protein [Actinobacteria bacterium]|nr:ABC transporter ATP-binding protein [Actinomycetota bacterium]